MNCNQCGNMINEGKYFCGACGAKVVHSETRCSSCNAKVESTDKFCEKCGADIQNPPMIAQGRPTSTHEQNKTRTGHKRRVPLIIIGCFTILAIVLIAGTVVAYTQGYLFKDEQKPIVSINSPRNGQEIAISTREQPKELIIEIAASDNKQVEKVVLFVDGAEVATLTNPPYKWNWNVHEEGKHMIRARAFDKAGNIGEAKTLKILAIRETVKVPEEQTGSIVYETERAAEQKSEQDFVCAGSDTRYLTESDLENRTPWELDIIRNEIYARHGRTFAKTVLYEYFSAKSWYIENHAFTEEDLSVIEKKNAEFILNYQKSHNQL